VYSPVSNSHYLDTRVQSCLELTLPRHTCTVLSHQLLIHK